MSDQELFSQHGAGLVEVSPAVTAKWAKGCGGPAGDECQNLVYSIAGNTIGRQIQNGGNGAGFQEDASYTLSAVDRHAIAFAQNQRDEVRDLHNVAGAIQAEPGMKQQTFVCGTLGASGAGLTRPAGNCNELDFCVPVNTQIATRWNKLGRGTGFGDGDNGDPAYTLQAGHEHGIGTVSAVRRLTPLECERLQGFPDGWTDIPYRGKPAPDGARYKALGNSMSVPCMAWIGRRIDEIAE